MESRLSAHLRAVVSHGGAVHPRVPRQDLRGRDRRRADRRRQARLVRAGPGDPAGDGHQARAGARLSAAGERAAALARATSRAISHGMRITDAVALDCAQEAAGQLRFEIEAAFSQGLPNTPMANAIVRVVSGNFLTARPVGIVDGVDFMHSGVVRKVDAAAIRRAIDIGALVLLSPFGFSPTGEAFNLTMEDVATSTAIALQADKLLFVTEVAGHPRGPGRPGQPDRHRARAGRRRAAARRRCRSRTQPTDTGLLPAALRARLPRRRRALAHPAVRDRRRAADGGVHARRHRHDGRRREAREPARGDGRRHRRRAAADRAVRARRHAGQARPHRDRARHRQLHRDRARRRDIRLRRALSLSRGEDRPKWRR